MRLLGQRPRYQEGPPRGPVTCGSPLGGVDVNRTEAPPDRSAEATAISLSDGSGQEEQPEDARRIATTSLAFSNALRTFYGFIYGPTHNLEREYDHGPYFIKRLIFNQEVAPIFGPGLFSPLAKFVRKISEAVSKLQSGYLNFYNALIGMLLVLILALALFYR